jgi:DNA gyrase subunit A
MISNRSGVVIRMAIDDLRVMGRATQGVRVIRLDEDDAIADVTVIAREEVEPNGEEGLGEGAENAAPLTHAEEEE